jgi:hypothetical protein
LLVELELELLDGCFSSVVALGALLEELELDGAALDGVPLEPAPAAWSFFVLRSIEVDEELELGGVAVVPPADEDDEEPGAFVAPEGAVDVDRSHAVISDAPSARETAIAIVDNLMWPPWLGYKTKAARIGPRLFNLHPRRVSGTSVLHSGFCVTALRSGSIAAALKVAVLVGVLRIDLALDRVRAFLLLGRCRRPNIRRCR